jgi:hypothetical protein
VSTPTVNGWPVLEPGSDRLHTWTIPGTQRRITMRDGSAGFLLAHVALRFNDRVERLALPGESNAGPDDGGYSHRPITGGSSWSQHATGTAMDLNWRRHPYGVPTRHTFTADQINTIHRWLRESYVTRAGRVIEWGGDWPSHPGSTAKPDAMHFQLSAGLDAAEHLARRLMETARGRKILDANPGQKRVILS